MGWIDLEAGEMGEKFKFEKKGDELIGHYMGSEVIEINGSPATKHKFMQNGKLIAPLGSADLDRQLSRVQAGSMTRVIYLGKEKSKNGFLMKKYRVSVDPSQAIPTSSRVESEKSLA